MQVGDQVRINAMDLPNGDFVGVVKALADGNRAIAVEITHKDGELYNFQGHDCRGLCNSSGWLVFEEELEVIS